MNFELQCNYCLNGKIKKYRSAVVKLVQWTRLQRYCLGFSGGKCKKNEINAGKIWWNEKNVVILRCQIQINWCGGIFVTPEKSLCTILGELNEQEIVILIAETVRGKDPAPAKVFLKQLNFHNHENN